jgi:hypothetical protein
MENFQKFTVLLRALFTERPKATCLEALPPTSDKTDN